MPARFSGLGRRHRRGLVSQRRALERHPVARRDRSLLHQPLAGVDDDLARAERLPRDVGRARRRAASALGARVSVEEILPRELLDVRRAELRVLGLEIHRLHRAARARTARVREVDVEQRRHDVQVLRVRQIIQEGQDQQHVRPPETGRERGRIGHRRRDDARDGARHDLLRSNVASRTEICACVGEQQRHHQPADQAQDDDRVGVLELVPLEARRVNHQPAIQRECHGGDDERRERVLRKRIEEVERLGKKQIEREAAEHALDHDLDGARREHDEAPEDRRVHEPSGLLAEDLALGDADRQQIPDPRARIVGAIVREAEPRVAHETLHVEREQPRARREHGQEDPDRRGGGHQCPAFASRTAFVSAGTTSSTSPTMP